MSLATYNNHLSRYLGKLCWVLPARDAFITTWNTENAGSATKTIVIPTTGAGYDCYIDWGDASNNVNYTGTPGNITHEYETTGIKTISIRGAFPRIYFHNEANDKLKLLTIAQWGTGTWTSMGGAFGGCENMTGTYTDVPNLTTVTNMSSMFFGCSAFNQSVSNFNTAAVTDMTRLFYGCSAFNQSVSNFNTAAVTSMYYMFVGCSAFNQSVSNFNTAAVTNMGGMFYGCTAFKQSLATFSMTAVTEDLSEFATDCDINETGTATNYDATLVSWGAQAVQNTNTITFGTSKYTAGGAAAAARAHLVLAVGSGGHGWTITDGGTL